MAVTLYVLSDSIRGQHGDHFLTKHLLRCADDSLIVVAKLTKETALQQIFILLLLKLRATE
jgi:hypothetical protein